MIYIFTALMPEAKPIIQRFELKKNKEENKFALYENIELGIRLVVTGVGQINMAIAVAHICARYEIDIDTYVINLGVCAGNQKGTYLIHKIIEETTERTFYPDLLIAHPFEEATLLSGMRVKNEMNDPGDYLYDMEGAAFYQSAIKYVWADRISLIKVVSDTFKPESVTPEFINELISSQLDNLKIYLDNIQSCIEANKNEKNMSFEEDFFQKLSEDFCCSVTMHEQLKHLYQYLILTGIDLQEQLEEDYKQERLPCKTRKEGKKFLDELKTRFL